MVAAQEKEAHGGRKQGNTINNSFVFGTDNINQSITQHISDLLYLAIRENLLILAHSTCVWMGYLIIICRKKNKLL